MAQFGRPSADTYNTTYTDQAGGSVTIYTTIDEVTASDADYIRSPLAPATQVYVTKLTAVEDPVSNTGHIVRFRYAKDAAGGAQINLQIELRQAYVDESTLGTQIAVVLNATNISETWTTGSYTLSGVEADNISAYNNLYLRFIATQV